MAVVIPYTKQTWTDGVSSCSAARNTVHEDGINDAHYQPTVRVTHNANQSTTTAVDFILAFNTEAYDQAGNVASTMHDNVTNNSRLTCRHAGIYVISAQVEFAANATGQRLVALRLNGATRIYAVNQDATAGGPTTQMICSGHYSLAVNDYVEVLVNQTSGGALNVLTTSNVVGPAFMMARVG